MSRPAVPIVLICACLTLACGRSDWREPKTGMRFVRLPTSPALWFGRDEVTQGEWEQVMDRDNTAWFHDDSGRLPMENVTWLEVQRFVDRLNQLAAPERFRLPAEREWETACHAGTTTRYSTGDTLRPTDANVAPSAEAMKTGHTTRVESYPSNPWGLFDMHGNVWEWTADAADADHKIIRGGSWYFGADSAACDVRYTHRPQDRGFSVGFRLVRAS